MGLYVGQTDRKLKYVTQNVKGLGVIKNNKNASNYDVHVLNINHTYAKVDDN
jgi:hypothetical protein